MKHNRNKETTEEGNQAIEKNALPSPSGVGQDKSLNLNHQLYQHAKEKLKSRLFEMGVQQPSMTLSIQKPLFQPNTIVPKRVIQGYRFYQSRLDETGVIPKQKLNASNNLNNVSSLVNQSMSMNQSFNKGIKLPKLNVGKDNKDHKRSRSLLKITGDNQFLDKEGFDDTGLDKSMNYLDRSNNKINASFGNVSPVRNNYSLLGIRKPPTSSGHKIWKGGDFSMRIDGGGRPEDETSFELNITYDEAVSRKIIDKLTGKNIPPTRIPYPPRFYRSNSIRSRGLSIGGESDDPATANLLSGLDEPQGGKVNQLQDIDSFIYLIKEGKINPNEFIYLVRKDGDHYNLKVTDYCSITDHVYWTLSAKGVTKYEANFPVEFIPLKDWLRERDQYNHIKRLRFFRQFRSWKTLKKWVKILRKNQRNACKAQLNEKLFIANPLFQKIILKHKEYCLEIEALRFVDIGQQIQQVEVQSLEDFKTNQEKKRAEVVEILQEYSIKLHDNARAGIKKILEKLRDHIIDEMANDEDKGQDELRDIAQEAKHHLNSKNVFEALGFPEFMNYGHRSMLRRECTRFLRLAYLLDFMAVEALGNMYIGSAIDLVNKFRELSNLYEPGPKVGKYNKKQYVEPLFYVTVGFDPCEIDESEIKSTSIGTEISNIEDFDLDTYAQFGVEYFSPILILV